MVKTKEKEFICSECRKELSREEIRGHYLKFKHNPYIFKKDGNVQIWESGVECVLNKDIKCKIVVAE